MTDLAIMVEQQIAIVKRDLRRIPLIPVPVVHGLHSVEAEPFPALLNRWQSLGFQADGAQEQPYIDEIGLEHLFHELYVRHENTVGFDQLHAAAIRVSELAGKFGVHYSGFFIDVAALHTDA